MQLGDHITNTIDPGSRLFYSKQVYWTRIISAVFFCIISLIIVLIFDLSSLFLFHNLNIFLTTIFFVFVALLHSRSIRLSTPLKLPQKQQDILKIAFGFSFTGICLSLIICLTQLSTSNVDNPKEVFIVVSTLGAVIAVALELVQSEWSFSGYHSIQYALWPASYLLLTKVLGYTPYQPLGFTALVLFLVAEVLILCAANGLAGRLSFTRRMSRRIGRMARELDVVGDFEESLSNFSDLSSGDKLPQSEEELHQSGEA